ncbi:MAG: Na+/H+ antiporter NhaC family protein, partial [Phycisphaerales bacterium]
MTHTRSDDAASTPLRLGSSREGYLGASRKPLQVLIFLLPLVIFLISCMMAFAMGTSWGTMGIVTPLAIPIALALGGESFLIPTLGA